MSKEQHYRKLENMYMQANCNAYFSPRLRISKGEAVVVIPVKEDFYHSMGAAHGHVYFKALDDAAFFAVNSVVTDAFVLTVSFTVYLLRPVSSGEIVSRGKVVFQSSKLFTAESVLVDSDGNEIARGSGSFMKSKFPLTKSAGYE